MLPVSDGYEPLIFRVQRVFIYFFKFVLYYYLLTFNYFCFLFYYYYYYLLFYHSYGFDWLKQTLSYASILCSLENPSYIICLQSHLSRENSAKLGRKLAKIAIAGDLNIWWKKTLPFLMCSMALYEVFLCFACAKSNRTRRCPFTAFARSHAFP